MSTDANVSYYLTLFDLATRIETADTEYAYRSVATESSPDDTAAEEFLNIAHHIMHDIGELMVERLLRDDRSQPLLDELDYLSLTFGVATQYLDTSQMSEQEFEDALGFLKESVRALILQVIDELAYTPTGDTLYDKFDARLTNLEALLSYFSYSVYEPIDRLASDEQLRANYLRSIYSPTSWWMRMTANEMRRSELVTHVYDTPDRDSFAYAAKCDLELFNTQLWAAEQQRFLELWPEEAPQLING